MNKQGNYTVKRTVAMLATMVYLFITVAYLFFTPGFQYKRPSGITKAKPNTQLIYTLIRTNRCLLNNNKTNRIIAKQQIIPAAVLRQRINVHPVYHAENGCALNALATHSIYLSNRVLRI